MKIARYDKIYIPEKTKNSQNANKWTKERKSTKGPYIHDIHGEGANLLFIYGWDGESRNWPTFYGRHKWVSTELKNKISVELDYASL